MISGSTKILVVDDERGVLEVIRESLLSEGYIVHTAMSGPEALDTLRERPIDLVITDIAMPGMDGVELLNRISEMHPELPVVMITGHGGSEAARKTLQTGAVDFVTKPFSIRELPVVVERNLTRRSQEREKLAARAEEVLFEAMGALTAALDAKDQSTAGHSRRVTELSLLLADEIGVDRQERFVVHLAAQLHDIGKIGIRDAVLHNPLKLIGTDLDHVKEHPAKGGEILSCLTEVPEVASCIRHHHERFDGNGYPDGLSGETIPLGARIIAVADSFEAIVSDRPYRKGMTMPEAVEEIMNSSGTQFDPEIVAVFKRVMEKHGSDVKHLFDT
jgi:putative two-component system response regulator